MTWAINTSKTAVVSTDTFWLPIDEHTPRNCKVLAISKDKAGTLQVAEIRTNETWYTHWHGLPRFRELEK